MLEKFNQKSKGCIILAQEEARRAKCDAIHTDHLLLALLGQRTGVASKALTAAGATLPKARQILDSRGRPIQITPQQPKPVVTSAKPWYKRLFPGLFTKISFTDESKKTLETALVKANERNDDFIGTEHILLALLQQSKADTKRGAETDIVNTLAALELDPITLQEKVFELLEE